MALTLGEADRRGVCSFSVVLDVAGESEEGRPWGEWSGDGGSGVDAGIVTIVSLVHMRATWKTINRREAYVRV